MTTTLTFRQAQAAEIDALREINADLLGALKAAVQIGVIGIKYADPTEDARIITNVCDMNITASEDPDLVVDFRAAIAKATGK